MRKVLGPIGCFLLLLGGFLLVAHGRDARTREIARAERAAAAERDRQDRLDAGLGYLCHTYREWQVRTGDDAPNMTRLCAGR